VIRRRLLIALTLILGFSAARAADAPAKSSKLSRWIKSQPAAENPTPVLGVRGLDKNAAGESDTAARDYAALAPVESMKLTPEELRQFAKEGNLR
jgi:hypothetical protein